MNTDRDPRVAEIIETRRLQLGLTLGEFAEQAGLTRQGLAPIRRGERRQHQDSTKFGVCRALRWTSNSIDLLFEGRDPVPTDDRASPIDLWAQAANSMGITPEVDQELLAHIRDLPWAHLKLAADVLPYVKAFYAGRTTTLERLTKLETEVRRLARATGLTQAELDADDEQTDDETRAER